MKLSVFVATSVDGYIARKDGSIDWLDRANEQLPKDLDAGFDAFLSSVDAIVMGRKTFEFVINSGHWPYGDKKLIVLSNSNVFIPDNLKKTVTKSSLAPKNLIDELKSSGVRHVYVDGGKTIHGFLKENLIDEFIITILPVALGEGIPLFGSIGNDISLRLHASKTFSLGLVQLTYQRT